MKKLELLITQNWWNYGLRNKEGLPNLQSKSHNPKFPENNEKSLFRPIHFYRIGMI
ncbi:MAG: hypothetical protein C5S49_03610 [Candidatus Methanogaster sp.]|nr:MAG: hypothetical protein C5S49_03610 [ANME-2 cluster archaeon]